MKFIHNLFDKLEYKIRTRLSHHPFIYALLGSVGIVVFWRGIWHTADFISEVIFYYQSQAGTINLGNLAWWDGPLSLIVGAILLLPSGLFVSSFIGNEIIISGLKGEKKFTDKTEEEILKYVFNMTLEYRFI